MEAAKTHNLTDSQLAILCSVEYLRQKALPGERITHERIAIDISGERGEQVSRAWVTQVIGSLPTGYLIDGCQWGPLGLDWLIKARV